MHIDKAAIVANLRARGLPERADWVDRQLSPLVDTARNASLLRTLGIDPQEIAEQQPAPEAVAIGMEPLDDDQRISPSSKAQAV
ncbi:hypothetical protein [Paractinoplanes hotanensis]|uniref:Uncharacterized protein n=1 Tax=Paractinoplanes hotanensis TaxID=2906497 RepID=A0ABT0Y5E0_9ACTN|nr:hypothetical protein [Actinoplanes hotanensis]MCM4081256.1 hypothetical protein [Actinoplanes hotanensis]